MRELCLEEGAEKRGLDNPAPPQTVENFHKAISRLGELRHITFPRSIHPDAKVKGALPLLVFGDGSRDAYCAIAHWPMADGSYVLVSSYFQQNQSGPEAENFHPQSRAHGLPSCD